MVRLLINNSALKVLKTDLTRMSRVDVPTKTLGSEVKFPTSFHLPFGCDCDWRVHQKIWTYNFMSSGNESLSSSCSHSPSAGTCDLSDIRTFPTWHFLSGIKSSPSPIRCRASSEVLTPPVKWSLIGPIVSYCGNPAPWSPLAGVPV